MKDIIWQFINFFVYIILQVFLFQHLMLFDVALPKIYLVYVAMLPMSTPTALYYVIVFLMGILLDSMIMPLGAHAFALVLIAGVRKNWVRLIKQQMNLEEIQNMQLSTQPIAWLLLYILPMILLYELVYNGIVNLSLDITIILKIFFSTLYSSLFAFIFIVLFYHRTAQ